MTPLHCHRDELRCRERGGRRAGETAQPDAGAPAVDGKALARAHTLVSKGANAQAVSAAIGSLPLDARIVGGIFVVLWFFAVRNGSRIDALRAERAAESDGTGADN